MMGGASNNITLKAFAAPKRLTRFVFICGFYHFVCDSEPLKYFPDVWYESESVT